MLHAQFSKCIPWFSALTIAGWMASCGSLLAYDTFGNGFGSKWGASPYAGTGAVVTWGFMPDGTTLHPEKFPFHDAVTGTSNITAVRNSVDANYGAGAFNAALQRAFDTWAAVANIRFVGPVADPGSPVAAPGAIAPNIRIGAFQAVPGSWFDGGSAFGIGPPGAFFEDPFSGDIIFNAAGIGTVRPYQIAPGQEDVDVVDVYQYGDDVEGLFAHELGHAAIGLEHPRWAGEDPDQRMMYVGDFTNEDAPYCCTAINRQLHVDDIAAAQYVYGIRGDYNRDGRVDPADYVSWRMNNGRTVTSGTGADGNVDGIVNALDYDAWLANFGKLALTGFGEQPSMWDGAAAGSVVPEPAVAAVMVQVVITVLMRRRMVTRSSLGDGNNVV